MLCDVLVEAGVEYKFDVVHLFDVLEKLPDGLAGEPLTKTRAHISQIVTQPRNKATVGADKGLIVAFDSIGEEEDKL